MGTHINDIVKVLRERLENHEYMSSRPGYGMRKLMPHHVDALVNDLTNFITDLVTEFYNEGWNSGNRAGYYEGYDSGYYAGYDSALRYGRE